MSNDPRHSNTTSRHSRSNSSSSNTVNSEPIINTTIATRTASIPQPLTGRAQSDTEPTDTSSAGNSGSRGLNNAKQQSQLPSSPQITSGHFNDSTSNSTSKYSMSSSTKSPLSSSHGLGKASSNSRIRRRNSPVFPPRPELLTDVSSLDLPTLDQGLQYREQRQGESRNDNENNSFGTASTVQTTANPCFKQDVSHHHLPAHTVSLRPPLELSHRHQRSRSLGSSSPYISVAVDNASIESGLTTDDMLMHNDEFDSRSVPTPNSSLAERTEMIIMEARRQSSRSSVISKRTDEIIREARVAASLRKTLTNGSLASIGSPRSSIGGSDRSVISDIDDSRRKEIIRNALDRASKQSKAAAAQAISDGEAIIRRSPVSATRSPNEIKTSSSSAVVQSLEVPNETNMNVSSIQDADTSCPSIPTLLRDKISHNQLTPNESKESIYRTQSAEEVLELAQSLLDEAQAQMEMSPRLPVPLSPNVSQPLNPSEGPPSQTFVYPPPDLLATPPQRHVEATNEMESFDVTQYSSTDQHNQVAPENLDLTSPTDSDMASLEDYEAAVENLPSKLQEKAEENGQFISREKILRKLDGIHASPVVPSNSSIKSSQSDVLTRFEDDDDGSSMTSKAVSAPPMGKNYTCGNPSFTMKKAPLKPVVIKSIEVKQQPEELSTIGSWFNFFMGTHSKDTDDEEQESMSDAFPVSCGSPQKPFYDRLPAIGTSLVRVANSKPKPPSYPEVVKSSRNVDTRMPEWVRSKFREHPFLPNDGTYQLGESKSIIVHEILRGSWTWCTAWSPDGKRLALATENHHLAVVDTTSSSVWRVRHDRLAKGPPKKGTTHSIRSISWGEHYIAIGGTGNAVSILAPTEPYPVLHTVTPTGFVGSLHWLKGTNKLLIGSRLGKAILLDIGASDDEPHNSTLDSTRIIREIRSTVLHMVDRDKAWVNAVQFSPSGMHFAVGDSLGILGVYSIKDVSSDNDVEIINVANFKLEDSILDVEWGGDGQYLYAGGEDFAITVISTQHWEPVHRIKRDRWVQFISSSRGSTHLAVGGVSSEVSILDVNNGWDNIINIALKGLVPLSAQWHPCDQYLVLTGQNNSILAIETTNARQISGHFLRSVYPIQSIAFSPDGRMAAVGNEMGVLSIFELSSTTFISVYEMVVDCTDSLSIEWSMNGAYVAIAAGNKVVIVARTETLPGSAPPNISGFFVATVIRDPGIVHDVSIDPTSRFVAASGTKTRVLDATSNFKNVLEMENGGTTLANSWSSDGKWFAAIGRDHSLVIYDTSPMNLSRWQSVFTVKTNQAGLALAWGPSSIDGLQYCAYGGEDKHISIMEIRTKERTWETVLDIRRDGNINDLDWNDDGLVAAAIGDGTVAILDLSYLQSGWAVNEMDYNWQRQALTCFTEIRRNRGKHSMKSVRWIPAAPGSDDLLAFGGTDGELEIIDLTERTRCRGFQKVTAG